MEHIKALAIKGIMTIIILYLILGLGFRFTFGDVLLMTIVLGAVSYFTGDLYVLPRWNNITAASADFGIAFLVVWLMGMPLSMGISGEDWRLPPLFPPSSSPSENIFPYLSDEKRLGRVRF